MASPADVCPVCLGNFNDPRVLPCLHSVCKGCVDKMDVTADDGEVRCPICRDAARLPSDGAAALPTDVTVSTSSNLSDDCGAAQCRLCDERSRKKPSGWCEKCQIALCDAHIGAHIITAVSRGETHTIVPLASVAEHHAEGTSSPKQPASPLCSTHGEKLKFYCGTCDVAICGDCTAIGDHKKHDNIRRIKDILEERKKKVSSKVDKLEKDVVRKLEHSLRCVDGVSTDLAQQADGVRSEIRQAGRRVVALVEAQVEQMVEEVDGLEHSRCKVLDQQRDKLKSHLDAAKGAISFRDRIMQHDQGDEAQFSLLHALDIRATALLATHIDEQPQHHSRIMFKEAGDANRACKMKESIGDIIPCQASAKHSEIENGASRTVCKGKTTNISIRAKDKNCKRLTTGGDAVSARFTDIPAEENAPPTTISDNGDGSYTISCACPSKGSFQLEVYINRAKMADTITMACVDFIATFDASLCHRDIVISEDRKKACIQHQTVSGYNLSVFGSSSMHSGHYTWKVKVGNLLAYHSLGVVSKPFSPDRDSDCTNTAYCWFNEGTKCYRDGVRVTNHFPSWSANDTFQLDLNCDQHTLQITNLRSMETSTFTNLPDKEYFVFASLRQPGNSVELLE